jgi:hypothetical protein
MHDSLKFFLSHGLSQASFAPNEKDSILEHSHLMDRATFSWTMHSDPLSLCYLISIKVAKPVSN